MRPRPLVLVDSPVVLGNHIDITRQSYGISVHQTSLVVLKTKAYKHNGVSGCHICAAGRENAGSHQNATMIPGR